MIRNSSPSSEVQRRSLLCNGVLLFEDTGELLPDGRVVEPHRAARAPHAAVPAAGSSVGAR
ncbi:DUF5999 family protein [Streptomyces sp. NPDC003038]|uniref:DUF5999 family protein n=1 Tax=Streptomyces sp. NPDC003038 TaxID=3154546 RepID=UPI00339F3718